MIDHKKRERDRYTERMAAKAKKKAEEAKKKHLWQINEEARKLGMTYGKYKAMLMMKGGGME